MRRSSGAFSIVALCAVLSTPPIAREPGTARRWETFRFPGEFGTISVYDRKNDNLAAVLVDRAQSPPVWTVVQKVGAGYRNTHFEHKVYNLGYAPDGSFLMVQTVTGTDRCDVATIDLDGKVLWSRPVGNEHAGISSDGRVVYTSTAGEFGFPTLPAYVHLYASADGAPVDTFTHHGPLMDVVVESASSLILASDRTVEKLVGGVKVWSREFPDAGITRLDDLGDGYVAAILGMGKSKILDASGDLVFDFDPETLDASFSDLTERDLRALRPFYLAEHVVWFFDPRHRSATVIECDLTSGRTTVRSAPPRVQGSSQPGYRIDDGKLAFLRGSEIAFYDLRPDAGEGSGLASTVGEQ